MDVAVVIPVRNGRATIAAAIASAAQHAEVAEIVVVDDGSDDDSAAVARSSADARVEVRSIPASGVGAARNLGVEATRSEWLVFLDADDELLPGGIAALRDAASPTRVLVCGAADERLPDGTTRRIEAPIVDGPIVHPFRAGCFAVRRSAMSEIGGYDERLGFAENTDLSIRLLEGRDIGQIVSTTPVAVAVISVDPSRERSVRYSERIVGSCQHFLTVHREVLDEVGVRSVYASSGAVAAARLRDWSLTRRWLLEALRSRRQTVD